VPAIAPVRCATLKSNYRAGLCREKPNENRAGSLWKSRRDLGFRDLSAEILRGCDYVSDRL